MSWKRLLAPVLCVGTMVCLAVPAPAFVNPKVILGGLLYRDKSLSSPPGQACMDCHHPSAGWVDPANTQDPYNRVVSEGVLGNVFGGRNAPSAAYASFSPAFGWDNDVGGYVGGLFWDGRATGTVTGTPLGDQAMGPFLNPVEMNNTEAGVVAAVQNAPYAWLFEVVYPDTDWTDVAGTYVGIAVAIGAFEESWLLNKFTSKYDRVLAGKVRLTRLEQQGLDLFNGKANCSLCHPSAVVGGNPPLFTDFTYDNLGIPKSSNPLLAANPVDYGLGGRLDIAAADPDGLELGKFKVPTLRNIAKTAPYGHNGYFATLTDIVDFYNTRDAPGALWDAPEVPDNVNVTELGNLGLTRAEVQAIVAFLETLSDGI
ncbi:MAG: c-type cytochrome [Proteobacteria bacterium]|nr:c-type cytochrome [Pseudomonadota bacterium]